MSYKPRRYKPGIVLEVPPGLLDAFLKHVGIFINPSSIHELSDGDVVEWESVFENEDGERFEHMGTAKVSMVDTYHGSCVLRVMLHEILLDEIFPPYKRDVSWDRLVAKVLKGI